MVINGDLMVINSDIGIELELWLPGHKGKLGGYFPRTGLGFVAHLSINKRSRCRGMQFGLKVQGRKILHSICVPVFLAPAEQARMYTNRNSSPFYTCQFPNPDAKITCQTRRNMLGAKIGYHKIEWFSITFLSKLQWLSVHSTPSRLGALHHLFCRLDSHFNSFKNLENSFFMTPVIFRYLD